MIVRLVDSFGWEVPAAGVQRGRAPLMLERRYAFDALVRRNPVSD
jgi:hypothetical protein